MNTDDPDFDSDPTRRQRRADGLRLHHGRGAQALPGRRHRHAAGPGRRRRRAGCEDVEFAFFVILLAVAGNETTRNAMTHGMNAFFDNPEQWELFKRERPDDRRRRDRPLGHAGALLPAHRAGGHRTRRRDHPRGPARRPVLQLGQLRRGRLRPAVRVQHPAQPQPALGFGGNGAHFCIGANLARMEIKLIFNEIADQIPTSRNCRRAATASVGSGSTASRALRSPTGLSTERPGAYSHRLRAHPRRSGSAPASDDEAVARISTRRARRSTPAAPTSPSPTSPARSASRARRSTGTSPAPTRCWWRPPCTPPTTSSTGWPPTCAASPIPSKPSPRRSRPHSSGCRRTSTSACSSCPGGRTRVHVGRPSDVALGFATRCCAGSTSTGRPRLQRRRSRRTRRASAADHPVVRLDPGRPPRTGEELRDYLRRWVGAAFARRPSRRSDNTSAAATSAARTRTMRRR